MKTWIGLALLPLTLFAEHTAVKTRSVITPTDELAAYIKEKPSREAFQKHWLAKHPGMTATQMAVAFAVIEMGGYSSYSDVSPALCTQVTNHAANMKRVGMGHKGWDARKAAAQAGIAQERKTTLNAEEIEGETFSRKGGLMADARSCIRMFKDELEGNLKATRNGRVYWHWAHAYAASEAFCYDMNCTDKCTCVGILAYKRGQTPDAERGVVMYAKPPAPPENSVTSTK